MNSEDILKTYQKRAMETCLPTSKNIKYFVAGISSETFELLAKIYGGYAKEIRGDGKTPEEIAKQIKGELGDVAWFLALACELFAENFESHIRAALKDKNKLKTDFDCGEIPLDVREFFKTYNATNRLAIYPIAGIARFIVVVCKIYGLEIEDVLQFNLDKLAKRRAENKICGDGDNR